MVRDGLETVFVRRIDMVKDIFSKFATVLLLTAGLLLSGCARDDSYQQSGQQGSRPEGGMVRGQKGRPSGPEKKRNATQPVLPEEAFTVCAGKSPGDSVRFSLTNGTTIEATCSVVDEHLVAVPRQITSVRR